VAVLPPTGDQYEISSDRYRAVLTQSGATLRVLRHGARDLVAGFGEDERPGSGTGQLLMPWPNRIRDGRYTHDGVTQQLPLSEPTRSNASHGLVRWAAWTPVERSAASITLGYRLMAQSGYPWTLDLTVTYAVGEDGLSVTQSATNRAATAAPYAAGAHPYLALGDGPVDDWTLQLPATTYVTADDRLLPTGTVDLAGTELDFREPRRIGATVLDTCFGGLEPGNDGRVRVTVSDGAHATELWADEATRWLMVFSADTTSAPRRSLAVEPMTAPVDAFNSGIDLVRLEPGATHTAHWGIRAVA